MLGGSHSYGLSTPASDIDYRGVFLNTEIPRLIGLEKHEHNQKQTPEVDEVYTEFRNALKLLREGNTQMIEMMYNENWLELSPTWQMVIDHREKLLDSEKLFKCLRGYMKSELGFANGDRTGKLGGKRQSQVEKYGFSPKNFVQLFRLAWAGRIYFEKGYFPVNVQKEDEKVHRFLMKVKTNPIEFTKERLNVAAHDFEVLLVDSFEKRTFDTKFDDDLANRLCLLAYAPLVIDAYEKEKIIHVDFNKATT